MTAPWLVALDVDGTILLPDETYSTGVEEAVARARDAGHTVTIATGRGWAATEQYFDELGMTADYVVCSNGAVTLRRDGDGWERWHVETFDAREVLALLRENLPNAKYLVELESGQRLYTEELELWTLNDGRKVEFEELGAYPVSRVVVVAPGHDEADFHRIVSEVGLDDVTYAVGWTAWLDIAPKGVHKGTALERVREALGAEADRIFVAGDGRNDIGMFRWAKGHGGRAVAMGQSPEEVLEESTERTGTVDEGGLAAALDTLP